jgi:pilus assembly protein Flp/PilA
MDRMKASLTAFVLRLDELRTDEKGQGLVEYGLILTFVAVVAIVALTALGKSVSSLITNLAGDL